MTERVREAADADSALVVVPDSSKWSDPRVVSLADLVQELLRLPAPKRRKPLPAVPTGKKLVTVFCAMPFDAKYDDVFFVAMRSAAKTAKATCVRVDQETFNDDIVRQIESGIRESSAVFADLSESKPNVLYEVGFAHALQKPTIHLCSTSLSELPFDVQHRNTLKYQLGQTHKLKATLTKMLRTTLSSP